MVRRIALAAAVALEACSIGLTPPTGAVITCSATAECPSPLVCIVDAGRCAEPATTCVEQRGNEYYAAPDGNVCTRDEANGVCRDGSCILCGNGVVENGEECDDANLDGTDACTTRCETARCGDGFVRAGIEQCDDGNAVDGDSCLTTCVANVCGDGVVDEANEQCDDGNTNENDTCALCRPGGWVADLAFGIGPLRSNLAKRVIPDLTGIAVTRDGKVFASTGDSERREMGLAWQVSESASALFPILGLDESGPPFDVRPQVEIARRSKTGELTGIAVDARGAVYFSEAHSNEKSNGAERYHILKLDLDGIVSIIAGTGVRCATSLCGDAAQGAAGPLATSIDLRDPGPLAFDQRGLLFFVDGTAIRFIDTDGRVKRYAGTGVACTSASDTACGTPGINATLARFGQIGGITFSDDNTLYLTDTAMGRVQRVDRGSGRELTTIAADRVAPHAIMTLANGDVLFSSMQSLDAGGIIERVNGSSGEAARIFGSGELTCKSTCVEVAPLAAAAGEIVGLALDAAGRLFIADRGSSSIRRIQDGIVKSFVGPQIEAVTPQLLGMFSTSVPEYAPTVAAIAGNGDQYFATATSIVVVRKATNVVEAVAGQPSVCGPPSPCPVEGPATGVTFAGITGLAVSDAGVFVADRAGNRVLRIADGNVSVVAGTGEACASEPCANVDDARTLALTAPTSVDVAGRALFVMAKTTLWRIDLDTRAAVRIAGDGVAETVDPEGTAALDASFWCARDIEVTANAIYVADTYHCAVRKIEDGVVTTVARLDPGGSVCSAAVKNSTCDAAWVEDSCTTLLVPTSMAVDGSMIIVADRCTRTVQRGTLPNVVPLSTFAGGGALTTDGIPATSANIRGIVLPVPNVALGDGAAILVSGGPRARRVDIETGIITPAFGDVDGGLTGPFTVASTGAVLQAAMMNDGTTLLIDRGQERVRRVDSANGTVATVLGYTPGEPLPAGSTGLPGAITRFIGGIDGLNGIAFDAATNSFVVSLQLDRLLITTTESAPSAEAWHTRDMYTPSEEVQEGPRTLRFNDLAIDSERRLLYIADSQNNVIYVAPLDGSTEPAVYAGRMGFVGSEGDGGKASNATLDTPEGLVVSPSGTLYIADRGNHRVRAVDADGLIDTVVGTGIGASDDGGSPAATISIASPRGLAFDAFGNLLVAGTSTLYVVLDEGEEPNKGSTVAKLYDARDTPSLTDIATCLKAPFTGSTDDTLFVGDGCTGAVIRLRRSGGL